MLTIIEMALIVVGALLAVPVLTICFEIVAGARRYPASTVVEAEPRPDVAVLVPAHNEEAALTANLGSILGQLRERDRLIVVADNCSDASANVARKLGAEVTVRSNLALRGKGYALGHGINFLKQTGAPEVVICIDADCQTGTDCIDRLARVCLETQRPTQAADIMIPPQPPGRFTPIVAFAWLVKDYVRPLGLHRMGFPCQLAGTGMAFIWNDIRSVNLNNGNLAEDLTLGLDLALNGKFPRFCPEARVTSEVDGSPSSAQRVRWEHGVIAAAIQYTPLLFRKFWETKNVFVVTMMLDLLVPPLALLLLLLLGDFVLAAIFYGLSTSIAPLALAAANNVLFMMGVGVAWWCHGQEVISLRTLTLAPSYAIAKLPVYVRFFISRQTEWVRGKRKFPG